MKLLVGTVFIDDNPEQQRWLKLQLDFLRATVEKFDHCTVLWKKITGAFSNEPTTLVESTNSEDHHGSLQHAIGLQYLIGLFKDMAKHYDYFVVLDSDAFPIRKRWLPDLVKLMTPKFFDEKGFAFNIGADYEIATVLRSEAFESRLHASVLFLTKKALEKIKIDVEIACKDLRGWQERDVAMSPYQVEERKRVFLLLRSNKVNDHPVAAGIYANMFYHHSSGSREASLGHQGASSMAHLGPYQRTSGPYWESVLDQKFAMAEYTERLFADPAAYVAHLAGWTPNQYVEL